MSNSDQHRRNIEAAAERRNVLREREAIERWLERLAASYSLDSAADRRRLAIALQLAGFTAPR